MGRHFDEVPNARFRKLPIRPLRQEGGMDDDGARLKPDEAESLINQQLVRQIRDLLGQATWCFGKLSQQVRTVIAYSELHVKDAMHLQPVSDALSARLRQSYQKVLTAESALWRIQNAGAPSHNDIVLLLQAFDDVRAYLVEAFKAERDYQIAYVSAYAIYWGEIRRDGYERS